MACTTDLPHMQLSHKRVKSLDISAECHISHHAAPFRTTPRDATLVPQLLWQIPH
jgi:hypothetical protein